MAVAADAGSTLRVVVTATNATGSNAATSNQTAVVAPAIAKPGNTTLPSISGVTKDGQTLTAVNGSWSESPSLFAYQWQRCNSNGKGCTNVASATAGAYGALRRRRRLHDPCGRDGDERGRIDGRNLEPDRARDGDRPLEHRPAGRQSRRALASSSRPRAALGRARRHLQLPVAELQRELRKHRQRDRFQLPADLERAWEHGRRCRYRDERGGNASATSCRTAVVMAAVVAPAEHRSAGDRRQCAGRSGALDHGRHLVWLGRHLQLPMAELRIRKLC